MGVSVGNEERLAGLTEAIAEIIDPAKWKKVLEGRRAKARGRETLGPVETGEAELKKAWDIILMLERRGVL